MKTIKLNKKPTITPVSGDKVVGLDNNGKTVNYEYDDIQKVRDAYRGPVAPTDPVPANLRNGDWVRCTADGTYINFSNLTATAGNRLEYSLESNVWSVYNDSGSGDIVLTSDMDAVNHDIKNIGNYKSLKGAIQKNNVSLKCDSSTWFSWDELTHTLSWSATFYVTTDHYHVKVLVGEIILPNNDDGIALTLNNDGTFAPINPDSFTTAYVCVIPASSNLSVEGLIMLGFRERDFFYPTLAGMVSRFKEFVLENSVKDKAITGKKLGDLRTITGFTDIPSFIGERVLFNNEVYVGISKTESVKWRWGKLNYPSWAYIPDNTLITNNYKVYHTLNAIKKVKVRFLNKGHLLNKKLKPISITVSPFSDGDMLLVKDEDLNDIAIYRESVHGVIAKDITGGLTKVTLYGDEDNSGIEVDLWLDYQYIIANALNGVLISDNDLPIFFSEECYDYENENIFDKEPNSNMVFRQYMEADPDNTLHLIIGTGQSNSVGHDLNSTAPLSITQPYNNLKVETSVGDAGVTDLHVIPLIERVKPTDIGSGYVNAESPWSGFANEATKVLKAGGLSDFKVVVSNNGEDGAPMISIFKNGLPISAPGYSSIEADSYANSMLTIDTLLSYAALNSMKVRVDAIGLIHGETDCGVIDLLPYGVNAEYKEQIEILRKDYNADIKAKTKQLNEVKLLLSQISDYELNANNSIISMAQLNASLEFEHIALVSPTYFLVKADGVHMTNESAQTLGEYFGKVFSKFVIRGEDWQPVYQKKIKRNNEKIEVTFHIPVLPLILGTDTGWIDKGFEFADDSGSTPIITSVVVKMDDTIEITLSAVPDNYSKKFLRYAYSKRTSARHPNFVSNDGDLYDSDNLVSENSHVLKNYCVAFNIECP